MMGQHGSRHDSCDYSVEATEITHISNPRKEALKELSRNSTWLLNPQSGFQQHALSSRDKLPNLTAIKK